MFTRLSGLTKKRAVIIVSISLVLAALIVSGVVYIYTKNGNESDLVTGQTEEPPELPELPQEYKDIDSLYVLRQKDEDQELVKQAIEYAKNQNNQRHLRVTALSLCLESAKKINDEASAKYCYDDAKLLLANEEDETTKKELGKLLDEVFNGTNDSSDLEGQESYE